MTEPNGSALAAALAQLQAHLPDIKKDETAKVETKGGGSFSYTYAGLAAITDAVMPLLAELGLSFIAKPTVTDRGFVLAYSLLHTSGEREDGEYPLAGNTPQARGSEITYARRYCLCAVTGIAPEDDDDGATAQREATRPASMQRAPGRQASGQQKALHALFKERGINTHEGRVDFAAAVVGHHVESTSELTYEETSRVLDVLKAGPPGAQQKDPVAGVDAFPDDGGKP